MVLHINIPRFLDYEVLYVLQCGTSSSMHLRILRIHECLRDRNSAEETVMSTHCRAQTK